MFTDNISNVETEAPKAESTGGPLDSGVYATTIDYAYVEKSKGGALGLHVQYKLNTGRTFRNTQWMTSGDAKGNKRTYTDKKTGKEKYLPGYQMTDAMARMTAGKSIADMTPENKVIKLWSYDQKKEVPTQVSMLMDLVGKPIVIGIIKEKVNKRVKNGDGYVNSPETREQNDLARVFRADDKKSAFEIANEIPEAKDIEIWLKKNEGRVIDKTDKTLKPSPAAASDVKAANVDFDNDPDLQFE